MIELMIDFWALLLYVGHLYDPNPLRPVSTPRRWRTIDAPVKCRAAARGSSRQSDRAYRVLYHSDHLRPPYGVSARYIDVYVCSVYNH